MNYVTRVEFFRDWGASSLIFGGAVRLCTNQCPEAIAFPFLVIFSRPFGSSLSGVRWSSRQTV